MEVEQVQLRIQHWVYLGMIHLRLGYLCHLRTANVLSDRVAYTSWLVTARGTVGAEALTALAHLAQLS